MNNTQLFHPLAKQSLKSNTLRVRLDLHQIEMKGEGGSAFKLSCQQAGTVG